MFIAENSLMKKKNQPKQQNQSLRKNVSPPVALLIWNPAMFSAHVKNTCMMGFLSH